MHNRNLHFVNDPVGFVTHNTINHRWFDEYTHRANHGAASMAEQHAVNMLGVAKQGSFDLQPVAHAPGQPQAKFAVIPNHPVMDAPLTAYWCPYLNGPGMPGFVDVLRRAPLHRFVFTAAMNGCAFFITNSPLGAAYFRVYHHQHPGNIGINALIMGATPNIISVFTFEDYGNPVTPAALPVAFNFLYYRNSGWVIVSQSTLMNPASGVISRDPVMPIVVTAANV